MDADVIVVGAGLAGLVATAELADAGRRVLVVDQEGAATSAARRSGRFGGLFLVDSPEQRRMGIKDSLELAWQDWLGSRRVRPARGPLAARSGPRPTCDFAAGEKRAWLHEQGMRCSRSSAGPSAAAARAERARQLRAALPHHLGHRARASSSRSRAACAAASAAAWSTLRFRHRVDELVVDGGAVTGVRGTVLEPDDAARGERQLARGRSATSSSRAQAVVVTSGGIGGNHDLVRANWPERLGRRRERMISGVPAHVDGRMLAIAEAAGGRLINRDRMWHYIEGIAELGPDLGRSTAIRILPGPVVAVAGRAPATGCRCRCSPASTPSARWRTCGRPATTTPGSCSPRRSSRRSSRSPARSRTPT